MDDDIREIDDRDKPTQEDIDYIDEQMDNIKIFQEQLHRIFHHREGIWRLDLDPASLDGMVRSIIESSKVITLDDLTDRISSSALYHDKDVSSRQIRNSTLKCCKRLDRKNQIVLYKSKKTKRITLKSMISGPISE